MFRTGQHSPVENNLRADLMKMISRLFILLPIFASITSMPVTATVLTFEDFIEAPPYYHHIGYNYGGLFWGNFAVLDGSNYNQESGYKHGFVSGGNIAYNAMGDRAGIFSHSVFDFTGAYFTGAWNNGLNITVVGSRNGSVLYSESIVVDSYAPSWFELNYMGIDTLNFNSFGGVDAANDGSSGTQFVMDNFTFNQVSEVPVPATAWLFGSGLIGLAGIVRRRK
jgi:hypothetical protein